MAHFVHKYWVSDGSGMTRRDRRPCEYAAYVPDPLASRPFALDGDVAADVADAEAAIARLNAEATALVDTEALARMLLRAEAVASSRIEGLEVGVRRLLRAEAAREASESTSRDVTADEVLGNIEAMVAALEAADGADTITVGSVLQIHERLLRGTDLAAHGGELRTQQNWIGGSAYNPCSAAFVPPPPEAVPGLVEDLCAFMNGDSLPAVAHAAVVHAQFETIHPFADGNGRTGRALIQLVLRRRGLAPRTLPPVSLVLATYASDYVQALTEYRYEGESSSAQAYEGLNRWVALFAGSCVRAVQDAGSFEERARELDATWRERLGAVRRDSSVDLLLRAIVGAPIVTVKGAAALLGRSFRAANTAIARLEDAGIIRQVTVGRRNRAFEAPDVIRAFTDLERKLASPAGDTRVVTPSRRVPGRMRP